MAFQLIAGRPSMRRLEFKEVAFLCCTSLKGSGCSIQCHRIRATCPALLPLVRGQVWDVTSTKYNVHFIKSSDIIEYCINAIPHCMRLHTNLIQEQLAQSEPTIQKSSCSMIPRCRDPGCGSKIQQACTACLSRGSIDCLGPP